MADSVEMMEKVKPVRRSQNIGTDAGHHRVIGAYYHRGSSDVYSRQKIAAIQYHYCPSPRPATARQAATRCFDAAAAGRFEGTGLSMPALCDPSPLSDQKLN
jgi:hypothetical protein